MELKNIRLKKGLTQEKTAQLLGISRRTYVAYEKDESKIPPMKLAFILHALNQYGVVDETHGILSLNKIKKICAEVLKEYNVEYAYLFGSYAKGTATETSDVDLLVSMPVNALAFYELIESLRENLKKKIDLLDIAQLNNNPKLVQEILRDGIKIYG